MKSYFGSYYSSPGTEPVESTVLVFDKNLNIGFRNPDGSNAMVNWLLKDVETSFDFPSQQTKLKNTRGGELFIKGNDAGNIIKEMQAEHKKAWHKQSSVYCWVVFVNTRFGYINHNHRTFAGSRIEVRIVSVVIWSACILFWADLAGIR